MSIGDKRPEDKFKCGDGRGRNLQEKDEFEYFDYTGETHATRAAIKIGALQCDRPPHGLDRACDVLLYLKHPRTLRTAGLRALAFTLVGLLDNRLGDAPSELLALGPHRGRHLW